MTFYIHSGRIWIQPYGKQVALSHLPISTGANTWSETFQNSKDAIFQNLYNDQVAQRRFIGAMHSFSSLNSDSIASAFDLSEFHSFVDLGELKIRSNLLGGCTGALAVSTIRKYPKMSGSILDLPVVLEITKEYLQKVPSEV